jgi:predicted ArsR family transcriptional regulator
MPKKTKKNLVELVQLQSVVALVEGAEADFETWLKDNMSQRARRQLLYQLLYVAKAYQHNVRVADDALTEQKALRARDAEGYEAERSRFLEQADKMADAWNKLMNENKHLSEQLEALTDVIRCQFRAQAIAGELSVAVTKAAGLGIRFEFPD